MKTLAEARVAVGFGSSSDSATNEHDVLEYLNLRLAALGAPIYGQASDYPLLQLGDSLLANIRAQRRFLTSVLCPADQAIHDFLESYLGEIKDELHKPPGDLDGTAATGATTSAASQEGSATVPLPPVHSAWLPAHTLILDRHGLARTLSLPPDADEFRSEILNSYRVFQGVCHNPAKDRRTTDGVFHVTTGGFPVPADKREVPKLVFARLLQRALHPPRELLRLPFTASQDAQAEVFLSLLLRPMVSPEVPGFSPYKSIEVRFFCARESRRES